MTAATVSDEQSTEEYEYQYVEVTNIQMHTKPPGQYKKWKCSGIFTGDVSPPYMSAYLRWFEHVWTLLLDLAKSGASLLAMLDSWQLHSGTNIYQYEPCFANAVWCNLQHSIKKGGGCVLSNLVPSCSFNFLFWSLPSFWLVRHEKSQEIKQALWILHHDMMLVYEFLDFWPFGMSCLFSTFTTYSGSFPANGF